MPRPIALTLAAFLVPILVGMVVFTTMAVTS